MSKIQRFHLAFPVNDLEVARHFYGTVLGCKEGRSSDTWRKIELREGEPVTYSPSTLRV